MEKDVLHEKDPGPAWLNELLREFHGGEPLELAPEGTEQADSPLPERFTQRWVQAASAAEYLLAMQESAVTELRWLPEMAFTDFIKLVARKAQLSDMSSIWHWLKLAPYARLDVASAREYGKLAQALRLPLEETLASVQRELAKQWGITIRTPVLIGARSDGSDLLASLQTSAQKVPFDEMQETAEPFQLMDLRLILSEVRASYGF